MKIRIWIAAIGLLAGSGTLSASAPLDGEPAPAAITAAEKAEEAEEAEMAADSTATKTKQRFLPVKRRIDREINKIRYVYRGERMLGLTASYGTLSSDDSDFLVILDNINADGTITTIKPYFGYFYRDNRCIGVRLGYSHVSGTLQPGARFDLGESNDMSFDVPYLDTKSNNYSVGLFHRTYAGLDPKGRFGLFAEIELSLTSGASEFTYESDGQNKTTLSRNTRLRMSFNPGAAVYIFPNVCATLSFGLGGIQYTHVTQEDNEGNRLGSRNASNMRFRLNLANISIGMTIHLWDKN